MLNDTVIVLFVICQHHDKVITDLTLIRIVIVAAGAAVLCGYAMARFYTPSGPADTLEGVGGEFTQAQYQRDVRLRNHAIIAEMTGHGRGTFVTIASI